MVRVSTVERNMHVHRRKKRHRKRANLAIGFKPGSRDGLDRMAWLGLHGLAWFVGWLAIGLPTRWITCLDRTACAVPVSARQRETEWLTADTQA